MSIEMIKKRLNILDELQIELNKIKETYNGYLEDDNRYQEVLETVTKIKDDIKEQKAKALSSPTYKDLDEQLKKLKQDIKDNKEILSQELADYYKETGSNEIEDLDGNKKKIRFSATLING